MLKNHLIRVSVDGREVVGWIGEYDINAGLAPIEFELNGEKEKVLRRIEEIERHKKNGIAILA